MSFDVAAEAYEAFMGRWSRQLSPPFLERSGLRPVTTTTPYVWTR